MLLTTKDCQILQSVDTNKKETLKKCNAKTRIFFLKINLRKVAENEQEFLKT